ncbi:MULTISPECIES: hypothetical protein [Salinibaculum]|uniref:hypothetical protein n=1 Tax=Salinibaculum TaxID=2732368 RepID=UPI0030CCF8E8
MGNDSTGGEHRLQGQDSPGSEGPGTLALSEAEGFVGDTLGLRGEDLPANEQFQVVWNTVDGEWGTLRAHEVTGPQYRPRTETIATVETDASGTFGTEWTVPEDYGGEHRVEVVDASDETVAAATYEITPWFELEETTAPMGGAFTIRGYGIGPDVMINNYQVAWDNSYVGYMTGVQNRGTATAELRAVGPPGEHRVQIWRGYRGIPFLQNNTQSPYGTVSKGRQTAWTVEVTEPEDTPVTAWVDPLFDESPLSVHYPDLDEDTAATLDITPECGQAGTTAVITGRDFPPKEEVDLIWYTHEGHKPTGKFAPPDPRVEPERRPDILPTVTTDSDGSFQVEVEIPVDLGSTRPITARVGGKEVAVTGFMLQPAIETFSPTSGPAGTDIEIEISGVGWTMYEMAPMFVYDNTPLGYACGLSEKEDSTTIDTVLQATGEPGWHFIDAYPTIFRMDDDEPEFELKAHLSYLDNHPVRPLPACHFAFEITE